MVKKNLLKEIFQQKDKQAKGSNGAKLPKLDRLLDGIGGWCVVREGGLDCWVGGVREMMQILSGVGTFKFYLKNKKKIPRRFGGDEWCSWPTYEGNNAGHGAENTKSRNNKPNLEDFGTVILGDGSK